jgi:hypothetical protein
MLRERRDYLFQPFGLTGLYGACSQERPLERVLGRPTKDETSAQFSLPRHAPKERLQVDAVSRLQVGQLFLQAITQEQQ